MSSKSHVSILDLRWLLPALCFAVAGFGRAEIVVTELMAANSVTLADEDGAFSDWIELYNPTNTTVSLDGWFLTDSASNRTKWRFPAASIAPGAYLIVFASNKNRQTAGATLHTNFALSAAGEYLGLIKPDGVTIAFEFSPEFPALEGDTSYGMVLRSDGTFSSRGVLLTPTPGLINTELKPASLTDAVSLSQPAGPFRAAFLLELSGAGAGQQIRYVVAQGLGTGAAPEPSATSTLYSNPFLVDATSMIRAAIFSASGDARGPVSTSYYSRIAPDLSGFTSHLPVLVLDSQGSGPLSRDNIDHPSWLYLYPALGNGIPVFSRSPELISPLTSTVRGSSSADFPKKGYNIKFTDTAGKKTVQAPLDLAAHERWALVAPWAFDHTYINNSLVYSLSNQIGRWAPRTRLVEVFFNASGDAVDASDHAGIYIITDRIEIGSERIAIDSLASNDKSGSAVTGGYILKIDPMDSDDIGWQTNAGFPGDGISSVVLVAPKADDVAPAQLDYIKSYIQSMEDALVADRATHFAQRTYLDYIDRDSWVDHHILSIFTANPDALTRSAYFTKDRGRRLSAGPVWDFDRALGSFWDPRSVRWDLWFGTGAPDTWRVGWWGILAQDPEFMQDWIDRWHALRRDEFSEQNLQAFITTFATSVGSEAADRDALRWPDNASPHGSYAAQINYLKTWVTKRAQWIDQQFLTPPTVVSSSGASLTFTATPGTQMAYTVDGSDPRSAGGEIAPNATLTSASLTVSASTNVHVRSYRADLRGVFPGSPWSAPVGGERSSPLSPKSRLVNISSRAVVGVGDNALIAGVVVADTRDKHYLARAIGPGLAAFGATDLVMDPQLSIFSTSGTELFRNNGWEGAPNAAELPAHSKGVGAFPLTAGSKDSVISDRVSAGAYTVQITTPSGVGGIALAELYELDDKGRTVNLSSRAMVKTGDGVLIGGFVVSGPAYQRILVRAVGPTLQAFGLSAALLDPVLTVYSGSTALASNDHWGAGDNSTFVAAASKVVGAFDLATNSRDAALLITLPPGAYTVEVKGKDGGEGVALLEVYAVP